LFHDTPTVHPPAAALAAVLAAALGAALGAVLAAATLAAALGAAALGDGVAEPLHAARTTAATAAIAPSLRLTMFSRLLH
jgi:hypothetical protein